MLTKEMLKSTSMKTIIAAVLMCFPVLPLLAQRSESDQPVIVQPGAPGQPTRTLSSSTTGKLPPRSVKDVEFMQGMIMHHGQAVEMTAMIESRTEDKAVRLIGAKISQSQTDEINFMRRWLEMKSEKTEMPLQQMSNMEMSKMDHSKMNHSLMPGMLSPAQMEELKNAKGADFDHLFLKGMIQHHKGALVMVKDLFESAGAGQDAELFNFTTDVDTGQRAEIKIMQAILDEKAKKEKR
jgi:uncharacterized protein (DUF305 family)